MIKSLKSTKEKRLSAGIISVEDVGVLFEAALNKSRPHLQKAAIKTLSLFPLTHLKFKT